MTPDETELCRSGCELGLWLDFYANVCPATKGKGYALEARAALAHWNELVSDTAFLE